jgi:hypothetical protein
MSPQEQAFVTRQKQLRHEIVKWSSMASERFMRVAHGVLVSNADLCGERTVYGLGLVFLDITNFKGDTQWLRDAWGLDERAMVFAILPNGAEWNAGVRHGDTVKSVMGQPVTTRREAGAAISAALRSGGGKPLELGLERDGIPYSVSIAPRRMCDCSVDIWQRRSVAVLQNDRGFELGLDLISFAAKDEDLAVIIGHELAHQIQRHEQTVGWGQLGKRFTELFTGGGYGEPYPLQQEIEADRLGLYYAARAGYSLEHAPDIWKRLAAAMEHPDALKKNRPYFASDERERALADVRDEIMAKIKAGLPLVP